MEKEIVNRVANSKLITFNLEDFYPEGKRVVFDISKWLYEGIVLREKEYRAFANDHDWSQYTDCYVALVCSTEAIIPSWAYMLLSLKLAPFAKKTIVGSLDELEIVIFSEVVNTLQLDSFKDKPVIIKGCSNKTIPSTAFVLLSQRLQPIAKSIMYGEACSSVPLYKKK